jgi:CRISPR-associated endonuclease/helicase Cas3
MSTLPTFTEFFRVVHGYDPFPWQTQLAERIVDGTFPDSVDLPTASGKTACLDIALYALAAQAEKPLGHRAAARQPEVATCESRMEAEKPLGHRAAARRIWFVVDRRIVVDEAFQRAEKLAKALENPTDPALLAIAERLLKLRGLDSKKRPLAVGRLRGGVLRDDGWARIPSQAAIITSTVDQLGSRLLFRGYGHSALSAPIFAGLAGNDSLILLDEAHCAVPFLQTLRAVKIFRSAKWSEEPNPTPFHVAVLSATPPGDDEAPPGDDEGEEKLIIFPADEDERTKALNHPVLQARLTATKCAELKSVKTEEKLAREIADAAEQFARAGTMRVGVIVNRVARAAEIEKLLGEIVRKAVTDGKDAPFDVHLLTGRIRPLERDAAVRTLHPLLHSSSTAEPPRPLILVSTQCLEVGADFSFDALVTECASLDALRQRFGRLARLGRPENSKAVIFAAEDALKEPDPIYGPAMKATWDFLWSKAEVTSRTEGKKTVETRSINFGFEALRALLPPPEDMLPLLAPTSDAPILLPAHLDLLCQTAPIPHPNPDIGIFLHGKGRKSAEARVAFRCDFDPQHPEHWPEIASLCRPVSGEMFSVPLHRLRTWLSERGKDSGDWDGDVEGELADGEQSSKRRSQTRFLIIRGREGSTVSDDPSAIYPDGTILLPLPMHPESGKTDVAAMRRLGQVLAIEGFGSERADLWELAHAQSGKPAALRLHRRCLAAWLGGDGCPPLRELMELIENEQPSAAELREKLQAVRDWQPQEGEQNLPTWLRSLFEQTSDFNFNKRGEHPGGGLVIYAKKARKRDEPDYFAEEEFENDNDDSSVAPEAASLAAHCAQVAREATAMSRACLDEKAAAVIQPAGQWHDAGKLDKRFQEVLRGGAPDDGSPPLAKSPDKPRAKDRDKEVREAAGLPEHFRHEMLSVQLAENFCDADLSDKDRTLLHHLIASHHGHARPFAPVCEDPAPPPINASHAACAVALSAEDRTALPAHRLDSGIADRFWQMTRRFGWWGLAYREAILRLADWHASEHPDEEPTPKP